MTKQPKTLADRLKDPAYLAEKAARIERENAEYEANRPEREARRERERLARVRDGLETEDGEPIPQADDESDDDGDDAGEDCTDPDYLREQRDENRRLDRENPVYDD